MMETGGGRGEIGDKRGQRIEAYRILKTEGKVFMQYISKLSRIDDIWATQAAAEQTRQG
jgi:hypothetical protein